MDLFSTMAANRLVGNTDHAAVLEITLKGPDLQFEADSVIAVTGADLSPMINGCAIPTWECIAIQRGSRLSFGKPRSGSRAYLAIAGGIDVPLILGSRATHSASGMGGLGGRPLKAGDVLCSGRPGQFPADLIGQRLPDHLVPRYERSGTLRIIPGPQQDFFGDRSLATLTEAVYTIAPQSDRMGYRLTGPTIARKGSLRFISDGTAMGAIQIPTDEQPILLMADRQTSGGYPKIAVVISADLPFAAQLRPGDTVVFARSTIREARSALRQQRNLLDSIGQQWHQSGSR